jgi:hypothetical protein
MVVVVVVVEEEEEKRWKRRCRWRRRSRRKREEGGEKETQNKELICAFINCVAFASLHYLCSRSDIRQSDWGSLTLAWWEINRVMRLREPFLPFESSFSMGFTRPHFPLSLRLTRPHSPLCLFSLFSAGIIILPHPALRSPTFYSHNSN